MDGYYVKPNFFSGNPQKEKVTFYLTDGGRDSGNICRIKEVFVSIDFNTKICWVVVPDAYGKSPFFAEMNVGNLYGLIKLSKFLDDVKEWLGLSNSWRKIRSDGKQLTFTLIRENEVEITVFEGKGDL